MRALILGAAGMLGHKLVQVLSGQIEVWTTVRSSFAAYARFHLFDRQTMIEHVDIADFDSVVDAMARARPDVVVNCIGVIKQLPEAEDPIRSLTANSLFPHRLHQLSKASGSRLVHFSTDCVFSGTRGMYRESDASDALDLYGRTKFLGETTGPGAITIRSSIVGRELQSAHGLIEWFLSQRGGRVNGYTRAIYSGITTLAMARLVRMILVDHQDLDGTIHVSGEPIDKYHLLTLVNDAFHSGVEIVPDDGPAIDRSLDSTHFREATGWTPPSWPAMIEELAADPTPYDDWRSRG